MKIEFKAPSAAPTNLKMQTTFYCFPLVFLTSQAQAIVIGLTQIFTSRSSSRSVIKRRDEIRILHVQKCHVTETGLFPTTTIAHKYRSEPIRNIFG